MVEFSKRIVTIYLGDVNSDIAQLRGAHGQGSRPPVDGNDAAWMHGYSAACVEIKLMVNSCRTFTADLDEDR